MRLDVRSSYFMRILSPISFCDYLHIVFLLFVVWQKVTADYAGKYIFGSSFKHFEVHLKACQESTALSYY